VVEVNRRTVLVIFSYNRPELTRRRLEQLVGLNCQIIVSIDAPKTDTTQADFSDVEIEFSRHVKFVSISENIGTATHIFTRISEQFQSYDNVIVIEDDVAVDKISVETLIGILQHRLPFDVLTIGLFGGMPGKLLSILGLSYWRKSRYFSAWGWAIQKEDWHLFNLDIKKEISSLENSKSWQRLSEKERAIWSQRFQKVVCTPTFTWDYQMMFYGFLHDKKHLLPLFRSCDNEGFGDSRAVNTNSFKPNWYLGSRGVVQNRGEAIKFIAAPLERAFENLDKVTWAGSSTFMSRIHKYKSHLLRTTRFH
jgi:hypothetical protein